MRKRSKLPRHRSTSATLPSRKRRRSKVGKTTATVEKSQQPVPRHVVSAVKDELNANDYKLPTTKKKVRFAADTKISDYFQPQEALPTGHEPAVHCPGSFCSLTAPPDILMTASLRNINSCFTSHSDGRLTGFKVAITKKDLMSVLSGQWMCDNVTVSVMHLT